MLRQNNWNVDTMSGEIVKTNYCIGFVSDKGLMLDLDGVTQQKAKNIAELLLEKHKLEGYLLTETSFRHYHLIFNKYLSWKKTMQIIFNQYICIRWGIWQARKGELTLRISKKNNKNKPKIIIKKGKTDKLIKDYLTIYKLFEEY